MAWLVKRNPHEYQGSCVPEYWTVVKKKSVLVISTHHEEGVADPQASPARGTLWDRDVLAVNRNGNRRSLTHRAAADVRLDVTLLDGHHGKRRRGGQPVGLVVSAGVVTKVAGVAVQEGHGAEAREAGAGQTCNMSIIDFFTKKPQHKLLGVQQLKMSELGVFFISAIK